MTAPAEPRRIYTEGHMPPRANQQELKLSSEPRTHSNPTQKIQPSPDLRSTRRRVRAANEIDKRYSHGASCSGRFGHSVAAEKFGPRSSEERVRVSQPRASRQTSRRLGRRSPWIISRASCSASRGRTLQKQTKRTTRRRRAMLARLLSCCGSRRLWWRPQRSSCSRYVGLPP